jgi:hypothetical protein
VIGAAAMMSKDGCNVAKLCPFSLGVGIGFAKAIFMMVFAWAGWLGGYYLPMIQQMAGMLHGYAPTFVGGLWGGLWGLIVGFVFGFLVGFFYDMCLCCCKKYCSKDAK